jgi:aryl hydrocarbon receptor nuclear translocator
MAFVAIARIQNSCSPNVNDLTNGSNSTFNSPATEFTCRCHWDTGEILFIDQRCTPIIGYQSHELLHKIIYEQIHPDDQLNFQDLYKRTVTQKTLANTSSNIILRFRTNIDNDYISLKTSTYAFCNPCTDEIEFIIVTFLSNQPTITNKTSVIANSNDYNRQSYDTYPRTTTNPIARYTSQSPTTYNNQEGQEYSTGNGNIDGRTYASNNGGSTWAAANDNWTTTTSANNSHVSGTSTTDYVDTPTNVALYHQYH